jgi:polysaccharide export outer membrane protein
LGQGLLELDEKLSDMRHMLRRLLLGATAKERLPAIERRSFMRTVSLMWFVVGATFFGSVAAQERSTYLLGPDDQIVIRALHAEEISDKPIRISSDGAITLPMIGTVKAAGLTIAQMEAELTDRLKFYVQNPQVAVSVMEMRSQPVSVLGAVNTPGVIQLQGRKTLVEVLSLAGGLRQDAGQTVKITRSASWGEIPLAGAHKDATDEYNVAEVDLDTILKATRPEQNITIRPEDVISVPRAEMIYVVGEVGKSGGFVLHSRESLSVLQAVSMAEGLGKLASPAHARILRSGDGADRREIPVPLQKIMEGKAEDLRLRPDDILFIPSSVPKRAAIRGIEAAIQAGTGILVWRH